MRTLTHLVIAVSIFGLAACGGANKPLSLNPGSVSDPFETESQHGTPIQYATGFPVTLPQDVVQPWEELGSNGKVISATGASSDFFAGPQTHFESGDTTDWNGALRMASGAVGAGNLSYAMYRIPLGGAEPGVVSVDANILQMGDGNLGGYYVGLADYGNNSWLWFGPVTDAHWRISAVQAAREAASFTSGVGNVLVCVVAHDGAAIDIVGVGVDPVDAGDSTPPDAPAGLVLTPVAGGIELAWTAVGGNDVAGYKVYYKDVSFTGLTVQTANSVEGLQGRGFILDATTQTYVAVSAVDKSGNESAISAVEIATPLAGTAPEITLEVTGYSAMRGELVSLTASGANLYDWDTDGDGVFDILDDASGIADVDTSQTGLIRPLVRGTGVDSTSIAMSAVSVIVSSNARPVAVANVDLSSGDAPHAVVFTGTDSTDFDGTLVGGGWDFDGDGIYDDYSADDLGFVTTANNTYNTAGVYNAKLKVVDNEGAWDVDTITVVVSGTGGNITPTASLQVDNDTGEPPFSMQFSATGSIDSDGTIVEYAWDFDGNGGYDEFGTSPTASHTFNSPGRFEVRLRVTDDDGGTGTDTTVIISHGWVHHPDPDPVAASVQFRSLATINGKPALVYDNSPEGHSISFVIAADADGTLWNDPVHVFNSSSISGISTLLEVNGRPAIAFHVITDNKLRYIRADDAEGASWPADGVVLDNSSGAGVYNSMVIVDGNPAIAYYASGADELKYVRAANVDGTSWNPITIVDSTGNVGVLPSLAVINGNPAIAYRDVDNLNMHFVRATDAQGGTWGTIRTPDTTGHNVGGYMSMAATVNFAAIVYQDATDGTMNFVLSDSTGANWSSPVTLDTGAGSQGISLLKQGGALKVAYYDYVFRDLKYIESFSHFGTNWNEPITLASEGFTGSWSSMAEINGEVAICYFNSLDRPIRYIKKY